MSAFPSLPLFTDAWVADTKHLSRLERGTYHDLLVLMWRSPNCRVPNDDAWLAKRLNMTGDEVRSELRSLITEFCQIDGNWITQKRLQREWDWCLKNSKQRSDSAKSRWRNKKGASKRSTETTESRNAPILSSPSLVEDDDGGERARDPSPEPLVSQEAVALADEITTAVGHDPKFVPPAWCGAALTISKWLREGWTREIILAGVAGAMARKRDGPPDSINYFEKPIARLLAQQSTPLPVVMVSEAQKISGDHNGQHRHGSKNGFAAHGGEPRDFADYAAKLAREIAGEWPAGS